MTAVDIKTEREARGSLTKQQVQQQKLQQQHFSLRQGPLQLL